MVDLYLLDPMTLQWESLNSVQGTAPSERLYCSFAGALGKFFVFGGTTDALPGNIYTENWNGVPPYPSEIFFEENTFAPHE